MIKKSKGFVGIDMIISIAGILIFSALIFSLMYSNSLENVKIRKEAMAAIYMTEIMENIGIASYEQVNQENVDNGNFLPSDVPNSYEIDIIITDELTISDTQKNEDIVKKVIASVSYYVGNKDYKLSIERVKMKE